jgi:hypothetical protein
MSSSTPIAANASTTIRICQRRLFKLPFDDHRCDCQDKEKYAEANSDAKKDFLDPAAGRKNPPCIGASKAPQASAFALQDHAGDESN